MNTTCHCGPYSSPHCPIAEHRHQAFRQFVEGKRPGKEECKRMAGYINPSWATVTYSTFMNATRK